MGEPDDTTETNETNEVPLKRRTPEEEEEYLKFQEKITQEQRDEAQRRVELMLSHSKYTLAGQSVGDTPESPEVSTVKWGKAVSNPDLNIGSLLRLFKSDFFDSWIGISYLYRYPSPGVHDYPCNALYNMPDDDIEFYLVELCTMLVHSEFGSTALEKFIIDKCKQSVHFSLQINWLMQASMADSEEKRRRAEALQDKCEIAAVNGVYEQIQASPLNIQNHSDQSASQLLKMQMDGTLHSFSPRGTGERADYSEMKKSRSNPLLTEDFESERFIATSLEKQERCDYFYKILSFVDELGRISDTLRSVPVPLRQKQLKTEISSFNDRFPVGIYLPLWCASTRHYCMCRLVPEEAKVLKSRERVPFIVVMEVINNTENASSPTVHQFSKLVNEQVSLLKSDQTPPP